MFTNQLGVFVRTVYMLGGGMIDDFSDQAEEKAATEAAKLALGSEAEWDNEGMRRIAEFLIGFGQRLISKLDANDANHSPTSASEG